MNKLTKLLGAAAAATLVAASGSAFTNSVGGAGLPANDVLGYGATSVSGGTVNSLTYTFDTAKSSITGVTLVMAGDTTLSTVSLAFNDAAPTSCGTGSFLTDKTTYSCTNTSTVAALTKTAVIVD